MIEAYQVRNLLEAGELVQANFLTAKNYPPNQVVFSVVSFPDYGYLDTILVPHDGTQAGVQQAAEQARQIAAERYEYSHSASQMGATGPDGKPWYIISPNGKLSLANTPAGAYAMGDLEAFQKDRLARWQAAKAAGDIDAADQIIMEQVAEYEADVAKYAQYARESKARWDENKAAKKAGKNFKDVDDRCSSWADVLEQNRRHHQAMVAYGKEYQAKADQWRQLLSKTVS